MKIGTKSLLFGVHQFLWHPLTVALAWRRCYDRWPRWYEWVAIFCHDGGYIGCENIDGEEGRKHPERGARLAFRIVHRLSGGNPFLSAYAFQLVLFHSRFYSGGEEHVSQLYLPDKVSILYEAEAFYLLRARLSGEIKEYVANSLFYGQPPKVWFRDYRGRVRSKLEKFKNDQQEKILLRSRSR